MSSPSLPGKGTTLKKRRSPHTISSVAQALGIGRLSIYALLKKKDGNRTVASRLYILATDLETRAVKLRDLASKFDSEAE